jgi:hypothetical protein
MRDWFAVLETGIELTRPDLQGAEVVCKHNKRRRYNNVQCDKDRTFGGNHPQHRLFGPDRSQRWSYQGAGGQQRVRGGGL